MLKHNLDDILERVRTYLPMQGPIKDFVHFNALAAFQKYPFELGIKMASELFDTYTYMPLSYYRQAYADGRIHQSVLHETASRFAKEHEVSEDCLMEALFDFVEIADENMFKERLATISGHNTKEIWELLSRARTTQIPPQTYYVKIRPACAQQLKLDWDAEINPVLFRVVSGYLDQGVALWDFPTSEKPFWQALREMAQGSVFPLGSFVKKRRVLNWLEMTPERVISELLAKIVGNEELYESYVRDTLMAHSGWSGMVNQVEMRPDHLLRSRGISLKEFLAFKLVLEWEFISKNQVRFVPLGVWHKSESNVTHPGSEQDVFSSVWFAIKHPHFDLKAIGAPLLARIWHEAFEMTAYQNLLGAIYWHDNKAEILKRPKPSVQAVFCLDDREAPLRRYLEENDPSIQTLGWPGFFEIDCYFQSLNHASPVQQCPPVLRPKHLLKEVVCIGHEGEFLKQKAETQKNALSFQLWREASSSIFLGFLAASTLGHVTIFSLIMSLFRPKRLMDSLRAKRIDVPTRLCVVRSADDEAQNGYWNGFTHEEMALRLENILRGMGLTQQFAPIVAIFAHGASSVNNPHFASYDCAACSGKSGAPNARILAHIANVKEVRAMLAHRGIHIPDETVFVGGYHDTTTDSVTYFDIEQLSEAQRSQFNVFAQTMDVARAQNAQERCRRFASTNLDVSAEEALHEVSKRAVALFEPRAELGHATCFSCVVGRRDLTRGLFLDRRAFLNSYDPTSDGDGKILTKIVSAAIPVCGTVNLDYFFSRVDPAKYGSGTKLSHNISGLLGVCNGIDDDLRTGLPVQMTELHDPIRLLLVIEQTPQIISQVLAQNPRLMEWVDNEWVRVASVNPRTKDVQMYQRSKGFQPIDLTQEKIQTFGSSRECYQGSRENVAFASIVAR